MFGQKNPTNNFKFKNCLFGAASVVKNGDKEKYVYSGYGITYNSACSWSFDNGAARNVINFVVDNSSSSHSDNTFLVLGGRPNFGINGSFGSPEKIFSIKFIKANTKLCLSLHCNADNTYLFLNGKEIFKLSLPLKKSLKPTIKMLTFQLNFVS